METIKVENSRQIPRRFTGIVEFADGRKQWFLNGKYHRVDGPAIEFANGAKEWWLNDRWIFRLEPIGDYIVIEDGLPSTTEWLGNPVSTLKVLTVEGIKFIPNLPGMMVKRTGTWTVKFTVLMDQQVNMLMVQRHGI